QITTEIEKGDGESSKSVSEKTNKYDKHGNLLESENKGGGLYASSDKNTYTYNLQNKVLVHAHFNACSYGVPDATNTKVYYDDGVTLKQETDIHNYGNYSTKTVKKYTKDGLILEDISIGKYSSTQTLYEYEFQ